MSWSVAAVLVVFMVCITVFFCVYTSDERVIKARHEYKLQKLAFKNGRKLDLDK